MKTDNTTGLFLMPFYSNVQARQIEYLDLTLDAIFTQSDPDWHIVIIDDASPNKAAIEHLKKLEDNPKITVLYSAQNKKQGAARNIGIRWAHENGYPFILFMDSDDLAHQKELECVRRIYNENPNVDVVYSTFNVIDEDSNDVPRENLPPSILEILYSHGDKPFMKEDYWIDIATKIGYTNLTSVTAVKTSLAFRNLFPEDYSSEDYYAWLAYSADGGVFYYSPDFPAKYRIPQHTKKDAARDTVFFQKKAEADEMAIKNALDLYAARCDLSKEKRNEILYKFYFKQFCTFYDEQKYELSHGQIDRLQDLPVHLKDIEFE